LHFIQSITTDYQLTVNEYLKLQRFTTNLWSQYQSQSDAPVDQQASVLTALEKDLFDSQQSHNNPQYLHHPPPTLSSTSSSGASNSSRDPGVVAHTVTTSSGSQRKKLSGSEGNAGSSKSRDRRASTAGITELMMKHGNASNNNSHSKSLSKSHSTLYSESSEYNYHQQQHQQQQQHLSASSSRAFSMSRSSSQDQHGRSTSPPPLSHGTSNVHPKRSISNSHKINSFFTIPSEDSVEDGSQPSPSNVARPTEWVVPGGENINDDNQHSEDHEPQRRTPDKHSLADFNQKPRERSVTNISTGFISEASETHHSNTTTPIKNGEHGQQLHPPSDKLCDLTLGYYPQVIQVNSLRCSIFSCLSVFVGS
jgi:hypothetical protein